MLFLETEEDAEEFSISVDSSFGKYGFLLAGSIFRFPTYRPIKKNSNPIRAVYITRNSHWYLDSALLKYNKFLSFGIGCSIGFVNLNFFMVDNF